MKQVIIILTGLFISISVFAQTRVVHGHLTVFNTYPVQNIEVTSKKAKSNTISDSLGQFSIVCYEKDIIKIKAKAFRAVSKKVGPDKDSLFINLVLIDTKANREIAVGYGYISEDELTYAVSHLQQENNEYCNYDNIFDLIKGRFPGVEVSDNAIYVRGNYSFTGKTEALYIVNGVSTITIDWISPCNIKTINVLKDSGAAIYGTRGSNGVVIIETKH